MGPQIHLRLCAGIFEVEKQALMRFETEDVALET
jgi:hypothetical protein